MGELPVGDALKTRFLAPQLGRLGEEPTWYLWQGETELRMGARIPPELADGESGATSPWVWIKERIVTGDAGDTFRRQWQD